MEPVVTDNREDERFEIRVDGELAGTAEYVRRPGLRAHTHTRIDPAHAGQGLGGRLVGACLIAARDEGDEVLPFCDFVSSYIERHPEHLDLVPVALRERFGLG
jgi:predicted GNAT family acetyltransferase